VGKIDLEQINIFSNLGDLTGKEVYVLVCVDRQEKISISVYSDDVSACTAGMLAFNEYDTKLFIVFHQFFNYPDYHEICRYEK